MLRALSRLCGRKFSDGSSYEGVENASNRAAVQCKLMEVGVCIASGADGLMDVTTIRLVSR